MTGIESRNNETILHINMTIIIMLHNCLFFYQRSCHIYTIFKNVHDVEDILMKEIFFSI